MPLRVAWQRIMHFRPSAPSGQGMGMDMGTRTLLLHIAITATTVFRVYMTTIWFHSGWQTIHPE